MIRLSRDYIERFFVINDKVYCMYLDFEDRFLSIDEVDTTHKVMSDFEISMKPKSFHFSNMIYLSNLGESKEEKENARNLMIRTHVLLSKNILRAKFGNGIAIQTFEDYEHALREAVDNEDKIKKIEQKKVEEKEREVTLDEVILPDEIKRELINAFNRLNKIDKYKNIGVFDFSNTILISGAAGNGKTFTCKTLCKQTNREYIYRSAGSLLQKYVGESSKEIHDMFEDARKHGKIIILDEIESIVRERGLGDDNGEYRAALTQLLTELDGFSDNSNILFIALSNKKDLIDKAILRRFRIQIEISNPDYDARLKILELYLNKVKHQEIDVEYLAEISEGQNGDFLKNLINKAAMYTVDNGGDIVTNQDILDTYDNMVDSYSIKKKESRKIGFK